MDEYEIKIAVEELVKENEKLRAMLRKSKTCITCVAADVFTDYCHSCRDYSNWKLQITPKQERTDK